MRSSRNHHHLSRIDGLEHRLVPATVTWDGGAGTGRWSDAANWDTNQLPQSGDDVIINTTAPVVFDADAGLAAIKTLTCSGEFQVTGGHLNVSKTATFAGPFSQSGGLIDGTADLMPSAGMTMTGGVLAGSGNLTIPLGTTWKIDTGNSSLTINQQIVNVQGDVNWKGTNSVATTVSCLWLMDEDSKFEVQANSSWQTDLSALWRVSFYPPFGGQFIKSGDSGVTTMRVHLTSFPTMKINSGTLDLRQGDIAWPEYSDLLDYYVKGTLLLSRPKFIENEANITLDGSQAAFINTYGDMLVELQSNFGALNLLGGRVLSMTEHYFFNSPLGKLFVDSASQLNVLGDFYSAGKTTIDGVVTAKNIQVSSGVFSGNGVVHGQFTTEYGTIATGNGFGQLSIMGDYSQLKDGIHRVELTGGGSGSFDGLKVVGSVSLGGQLLPTMTGTPQVGDSFVVIDNDGVDPVTGNFIGWANGQKVTIAGKELQINYAGGDGNDVTLTVTKVGPVTPPTAFVFIEDGSAQRSMVRNISIAFNEDVTVGAGAFQLQRTGPGSPTGPVTFSTYRNGNIWNLSFPYEQGRSLVDGNYTLTVVAAQVSNAGGMLDGNGDGVAGDNLVFNFHRLFGDGNGDRRVDAADLAIFRTAFGTAGYSIFDFNNDYQTSASDFSAFRLRYGVTLLP